MASYKATLEEQGWRYEMRVSFVEIYCEKIRDLLRHRDGKVAGPEEDHKIARNDYGANEITNVAMVEVDPADRDHIDRLMEVGNLYLGGGAFFFIIVA